MSDVYLPVACNLTPTELQERRIEVLKKARAAITEIKELEDGFLYQFPARSGQLAELARLVELEHQCCPFLTFQITVEPGNGSIRLKLTGPEGTKAFLRELFD